MDTYRPVEFIFQCRMFCLFIVFIGFSRQEYWSGLPFPSTVDHILSDLSTMTHWSGWPYVAWLNFIVLDKAVVRVIRLASCLWLWLQSVCLLMPSLSAYHLTWISLTLDVGFLFTAALASCCSRPWTCGIFSWPPLLNLDVGYLFSAATHDFGCGVSPLGCSCAAPPPQRLNHSWFNWPYLMNLYMVSCIF